MKHFYLIILISLSQFTAAFAQLREGPNSQVVTNASLLALATNQTPAGKFKHLRELLQAPEDPISGEIRPYWTHATVRAELDSLRVAAPSSAEGKSARLWLALINQYTAQSNTTPTSSRAAHRPVVQQLKELREGSKESWHSKAVDVVVGHAELGAGNPSGARVEFTNLLIRLTNIINESHEEFSGFMKASGLKPEDIEPEAILGIAMAFSFEGKNSEAIKTLEDVKTRFPRWSKKNYIDSKIEFLQRGSLPWRLPAYN